MARKKPTQYVPLEERPEFLALVAELVNVLPEQFPAVAQQCVEKYHDAVLAGHVEVLGKMEMAYKALVYKLNGETMFGCGAGDGSPANVLARAVAARPGQVPSWGQCGEFLLEVEGMRIRVEFSSNMLGEHHSCDLHAVDLDRPFLSTTGYRSAGVMAFSCLGESVDQAVRRMVLDLLENAGKPKPIVVDQWAQKAADYRPEWLADALAGVRPNGQMVMFGDAPKAADDKVPMSNAERQRALRKRRKEQQLKPVMLNGVERQLLEKIRKQWEGMPTLASGQDNGDFSTLEVTDKSLLSVWNELSSDFSRCATALGLLRLRNSQHAELVFAVNVLKARLGAAGLSTRISDMKQEWHWNREPFQDYRVTSAPEYMERQAQISSAADEIAELRRQVATRDKELAEVIAENRRLLDARWKAEKEVGSAANAPAPSKIEAQLREEIAGLQREQGLLIAERGKANDAVAVLQERLKKAGLSSDYRRQPGE